MSKNVEINYKNEEESYEVLYPKTTGDMVQVSGSHEGNLNVVLDSLIAPELIISTVPNASVTATCDKGGVSGNADDNGSLVLRLPYYGNYTVVASLMGVSAQEEITVDTVKQYPITIMLTGLFNLLDWATINTLLSKGQTSLFNVGEVKTLILNGTAGSLSFNNTTAYATIISLDRNRSNEGNTNLHLQLALDSGNTKLLGNAVMNATATNNGGWGSCQMRTRECANLFNCLPSDLQAIVKTTTKYTSAGSESTSIVSSSDKIFLLSEFEILGYTSLSVSEEGNYQQQYSWYSNHGKIKYNSFGSEDTWWERSPYRSTSNRFCYVMDSGSPSYSPANNSQGVAPCLCI